MVVSVLHGSRGPFTGAKRLDGEVTDTITAFLFHRGGHEDPGRLKANTGKSFVGSYVLGMGFTFDDTDKKGIASSLADMHRLIEQDRRNQEVIFPYIGGEEVNNSPTHAHHRYVINFRDYPLSRGNPAFPTPETRYRNPPVSGNAGPGKSPLPEAVSASGASVVRDAGNLDQRPGEEAPSWAGATEEQRSEWLRQGDVPLDYPGPVAEDWRDLVAIVEEKVRPERMKVNRKVRRDRWWQFGDRQPALSEAVAGLDRVLAISRVGQQAAFALLPPGMVYAESTIVFPLDTHAAFCALQSRPHEIWARFFGSSMKDDLRYTPSDCFETFPFPGGWRTDPALEAAGQAYYDFRASLMVRNDEGLTKTYNRFHDPDEDDPDIARLRELHAAMDRVVLDAYGWQEIPTHCDFFLDYEIDDEDGTATKRKKPYRYRWPDEIRDDVLARLLELNAQRPKRETGTKPAYWEEDDGE